MQVCVLNERSASKPFIAEVNVNSEPLVMEVDTGAAVSLVSQFTFRQL